MKSLEDNDPQEQWAVLRISEKPCHADFIALVDNITELEDGGNAVAGYNWMQVTYLRLWPPFWAPAELSGTQPRPWGQR